MLVRQAVHISHRTFLASHIGVPLQASEYQGYTHTVRSCWVATVDSVSKPRCSCCFSLAECGHCAGLKHPSPFAGSTQQLFVWFGTCLLVHTCPAHRASPLCSGPAAATAAGRHRHCGCSLYSHPVHVSCLVCAVQGFVCGQRLWHLSVDSVTHTCLLCVAAQALFISLCWLVACPPCCAQMCWHAWSLPQHSPCQ